MSLFRGYVRTRNKQSLDKFKNVQNLRTLDEVRSCEEYAGVLADDVVLIDIDEAETSDVLLTIVQDLCLKCKVYQTTRGKHFVFKNTTRGVKRSWTHVTTAIGLMSDCKVGANNSIEVLKFGGKERPIIYDCDEAEIQELPKWLRAVPNKYTFPGMTEGDGRNDAYYAYILVLQSHGFGTEEARECIRMINKYVVKEPLSERELAVILRDESFQKQSFYEDGKFQHDKFGDFLIAENHILRINEHLHVYKDGVYIQGERPIEASMINYIPNIKKAQRSETLSYVDLAVGDSMKAADPCLIAFNNGIYDLTTGAFSDFSPELVITNRIPWDYNPAAHDENLERTLEKLSCGDKSIRALLEEMVGYCMYRRNELGKAFILIGDKANGKSTFLHVVKNMLGDDNISSLDLRELGDRFKTAELLGKLANIGDDIGDEFIADASIFKKLVTGDRVNVERKGKDPFEFNNYAKFLFSANNIPRIKDKTGAVLRRLVIVPFEAQFSAEDPDYDPWIKDKLCRQTSMEYLIKLGLSALKRVLTKNSFSESVKVEVELAEYDETNNPIIGFIADTDIDTIVNHEVNNVFYTYKQFCIANNMQAIGLTEFVKQINRRCGLKSVRRQIAGNRTKIFERSDKE